MLYLNLNLDFNPYNVHHTVILKHKSFKFPGGEMHIQIDPIDVQEVTITTRLNTSDEIMLLLMANDALIRMGATTIHVFAPYLPYARQDRVMIEGEPLALKVLCQLINNCNFKSITLFDVHSEVSTALLNNVKVIDNYTFIKDVVQQLPAVTIVAPDAGAYKKIFKLCEKLKFQGQLITASKVRDLATGKIKGVQFDDDDLHNKDILIIDDICDGGGTFAMLADELKQRNCGNIYLAISHGIFSKGEEVLKEKISKVFTTDSIKKIESNFIKQIQLCKIII